MVQMDQPNTPKPHFASAGLDEGLGWSPGLQYRIQFEIREQLRFAFFSQPRALRQTPIDGGGFHLIFCPRRHTGPFSDQTLVTYFDEGILVKRRSSEHRDETAVRAVKRLCYRNDAIGWNFGYFRDVIQGNMLARNLLAGRTVSETAEQHAGNLLIFRVEGMKGFIRVCGKRFLQSADVRVILQCQAGSLVDRSHYMQTV